MSVSTVPGDERGLSENQVMTSTERHDFSRPWAPFRKKTYIGVSVLAALICFVPFIGVIAQWWAPEPSGTIAAGLVCIPIIIPMVVAWIDAPGENRTTLERAYEFMIVWFPITALSQVLWELTWLVGDLLGYMNLTADDHWGWFWWFYGAADTRYLISDGGLFGMESMAVFGGTILIYQWFLLLGKARHDDAMRIRCLWRSFFSFAVMLTVICIYYIAELRDGLVHIQQGFWGLWLKFIFMNIPWLVAPIVCMPFIIKQVAYLYRAGASAATGGDHK